MNAEYSVIVGIHPILEKLKARPDEIVEIFLRGSAWRLLEAEAKKAGVRVSPADRGFLDRLAAGQRHQGAVARVQAYGYRSIDDLLQNASSPAPPPRVLLLDGVTDPRNFGALLRCADGAGAPHVVIPKDRSVGVTPAVVKASAGAAHHVNIYRVTNLRQAMTQLKSRGFWLAGLDAAAKSSIYDRSYPDKLGIVLGGEGQGIRPIVRRECDFLVSIPMAGKVASLNVAVAGAVFLYETLRQSPKR